VPRLCEFCPSIYLTTEEKARKTLSQGKKNLSQINKNLSQCKNLGSLASSCWDFCGENDTGTGFCPSIRIHQLFLINIFLPVIHTHTLLIYHRCYKILAFDIVVK